MTAKVCPFCGSDATRHVMEGDFACRWVHCTGCGARGPTVTIIGCLSQEDQKRRAREKFYAAGRAVPRGVPEP